SNTPVLLLSGGNDPVTPPAYARRAIEFAAATHVVGEAGEERLAALFVSPVLRSGDAPRDPAIPATLQAALTEVAIDPAFSQVILAPFWIATSAIARLRPSDLREAAEALVNGQEPPIPPAPAQERDVCLLGLTVPVDPEGEWPDEEETAARLDRWEAIMAEAAGGGQASAPLPLARALDLLRRARLALPDEGPGDEEEEPEVNEVLLAALVAHLAGIGTGSALIAGGEGGVVALSIADGAVDMELDDLVGVLNEALVEGGILFVVPATGGARGHAFMLERGEAEGVSAADAAALFAEEAPADWAAAPAAWEDAPPLDYDPGA
ncbi:MAG: hypothetical protein K2X46_10965, partial [Roseomonas sp.]|nr:hypothetical protein [Roseomonas sp.]